MTGISINAVSGIAREKSQHFATQSLVSSCEMTSEERAQIPGSESCFSLVVPCGKIASTNQMENGVMSRHQYGISPLIPHTKFRGETTGSVAKFRLFSQALFWTINSPLIQISERPNYAGARKKTPLVRQLLHI